jgi:large subunit ribosomal protein L6
MSKVGKKPVELPTGTTPKLDGQKVSVKGPKGELHFTVPDDVAVVLEGNVITVNPRSETKRARALWGTSRARIQNLVTGVTKGFEKKLEITGVGYKAAVEGKNLNLSLGYSHPVLYPIPAGIAIVTPKPTEIVVSGIDAQQVGQVAAEIRAYRGPEPFKGKGVRYEGEFIFRKEGKKK